MLGHRRSWPVAATVRWAKRATPAWWIQDKGQVDTQCHTIYVASCSDCALVGVYISNKYFCIPQVPELRCPAHRGIAVVLYWGLEVDNTHNGKNKLEPYFGICSIRLNVYVSLYVEGLPVRSYINHHGSDLPLVRDITQDSHARDDIFRILKYQPVTNQYQIRSDVVAVSCKCRREGKAVKHYRIMPHVRLLPHYCPRGRRGLSIDNCVIFAPSNVEDSCVKCLSKMVERLSILESVESFRVSCPVYVVIEGL